MPSPDQQLDSHGAMDAVSTEPQLDSISTDVALGAGTAALPVVVISNGSHPRPGIFARRKLARLFRHAATRGDMDFFRKGLAMPQGVEIACRLTNEFHFGPDATEALLDAGAATIWASKPELKFQLCKNCALLGRPDVAWLFFSGLNVDPLRPYDREASISYHPRLSTSAVWKKTAAPSVDPLMCFVAEGESVLCGKLAERIFSCLEAGDDRAFASLRQARDFASHLSSSSQAIQFKQCEIEIDSWLVRAKDRVQNLLSSENHPADSSIPASSPTGETKALSEDFLTLILEEARALRVEMASLRAEVAELKTQKDASPAHTPPPSRLKAWRNALGSEHDRPVKTPGRKPEA